MADTVVSIDTAPCASPIADAPVVPGEAADNESEPADTRFLHVLQGANPGVPLAPATYLQSTGGVAFDGAVFAGAAVYFPVTASGAFTGTTLTAPAGVTVMLVAGLTPNASYSVNIQSSGTGNTVSISPGGGTAADSGGVLRLSF